MSIKFSIPNAPTQADYNTTVASGSSIPIVNKPALKTVATSGAYNDLTGRPALALVATTGKFADLVDEPVLATVATSGAYTDLTGRPGLATVATSGAYNDLSAKPSSVTAAAAANTWATFLSNGSSVSISSDTQNFAGVTTSVGRFVQAWYFAAAPVTVAAGDMTVTLNNTNTFLRGWEYTDPSLGFTPGNVVVAGANDQSLSMQNYPGFVNLNAPTFSGTTNYDIAANSFKTVSCAAFTLPAGWNELRLYYQGNPGYFYVQNSLSFNNLYAFPTTATPVGRTLSSFTGQFNDVQTKRVVARNASVLNSLRQPGALAYRYTLTTALSVPVAGANVSPWTLVANASNTGGFTPYTTGFAFTIPVTGTWTITAYHNYGAANTYQNHLYSLSGTYPVGLFASNASSQSYLQMTYTGVFAAGDSFSNQAFASVASTLQTSSWINLTLIARFA